MKAFCGLSIYVITAAFSLAGGTALAQQSSGPKQVISTPNAPEAIGPYSQAIKAGNIVFLAGQIPIDPKKMVVFMY